ncbi:hypothetical protein EMIHUDRAFT_194516 [Emiliania huxleyi CCMP1516]|uniref:EF-hand domain-containing protein n=2 Tax=Emiliania huxleyi TaxID=2903 RepID=A0A0D3L1N6_EMIH1|nr:hypothetical protein EMIHUDRAFT_194516 [Emiliania huxleyi CCMP1516]EOD41921.1 hypothetical protein EMIHUDRAFT_194516 [Emiliania huxleyi CCMP1516]|eukprot:XP_005794350.1 hypothetical protein EMIHUDRAFT_194516 [Emiliania huxleyi CCMP1516]
MEATGAALLWQKLGDGFVTAGELRAALGGRLCLRSTCFAHAAGDGGADVWGPWAGAERPARPVREHRRVMRAPGALALLFYFYVVARPAHAHVLASTAAFGGAICAFIALWILLAPIGLFPTARSSAKSRRRPFTPSQPVAGSHGSLFLSTSLNFDTARLQRGTTIVLRCCSLTFPTALALAHFGLPLLAFGELFSALLPRQFAGTVELEYPLLDASAVKLDLMMPEATPSTP